MRRLNVSVTYYILLIDLGVNIPNAYKIFFARQLDLCLQIKSYPLDLYQFSFLQIFEPVSSILEKQE